MTGWIYQRPGDRQTGNEIVEHLVVQQLHQGVSKADVVLADRQDSLVKPFLVVRDAIDDFLVSPRFLRFGKGLSVLRVLLKSSATHLEHLLARFAIVVVPAREKRQSAYFWSFRPF